MKRTTTSKPRIAIVDDEPDFRSVVSRWLEESYDTLWFESAEDLLESPPDDVAADLIITDVRMPGMDGFGLCECLRGHPCYAHVPVLFLTGVGAEEGFLHGQEVGASAYLTKPVERENLLGRIEQLLDTKAL